jgi:broad specificity phosphatase PhoE
MNLLLARHAETVWHRENRYAGSGSDIDLTPLGVQQAQQLADWVATRRGPGGVRAVVASPMRRALATAEPSSRAARVPLEVEVGLCEIGFGVAEGLTADELDPDVMARFRADPVAHPFPGAEPAQACADRVVGALRRIAERHRDGPVLVVAHNTALRLALCALIGLPLARYRQVFPRLQNVAVSELALPGGGPASLLSLNVPVLDRAVPPRKELS